MKDKNFQVLERLKTLPKITTKRTLNFFLLILLFVTNMNVHSCT